MLNRFNQIYCGNKVLRTANVLHSYIPGKKNGAFVDFMLSVGSVYPEIRV